MTLNVRAGGLAMALLAGLLVVVFGAGLASARTAFGRHGSARHAVTHALARQRRHRHRRHSPRRERAHASIIGGSPAQTGTFPWLAYIIDQRGEELMQCTGTVVASNLILTAGHCAENMETGVVNEPSGYRVVTGNVNWTSPERQVSAVSQVIVYPGFVRSVDDRDAALLELSSHTASPAIGLASNLSGMPAGTAALIAGWGRTYYGQEELTEQLQWAETAVQGPEWCEHNASYFYSGSELCAIDPPSYETGACGGDSGGPLIARWPSGGGLVEIGITIRVYAECSTTHPSVFTRADLISSWVHEWADTLKPAPPPPPSTPPPAQTAPPPPPPPAGTKLPSMTSAEAKALVRRGLTEDFGAKFKRRHQYRASCKRIETAKQRCSLSWYYGPNDYYGSVTVYYTTEGTEVVWGDRYAIHWVNDYCYYHTSHWWRCRVHTRRR